MTPAGDSTPARSSRDRSAWPISPAPRIAITPGSLPGRADLSAPGGKRAQEERQVRWPFREPPDQVAVPVAAVGDVDAHRGAAAGQAELLGGPDAVEHLVLEAVSGPARRAGPHASDPDQPRVVRGDHRVTRPLEQHPQAPRIAPVPPRPGRERDRLRPAVGALSPPDPPPG